MGTKIFTIGITDQIDEEILREMSSPPKRQNETYWLLPNFQALEPVARTLEEQMCANIIRVIEEGNYWVFSYAMFTIPIWFFTIFYDHISFVAIILY